MSFLFSMDGIEIAPEQSAKSQTCSSGTFAEMMLATEATKRGFSVFFPIGHQQKADLVIWRSPQKALTVQVKKATHQSCGSFKFMIGSGRPSCASNPNDYGARYRKYEKGDFDIMAAFVLERMSFIFYRLDDIAGKSAMHWSPSMRQRENNWDIFDSI